MSLKVKFTKSDILPIQIALWYMVAILVALVMAMVGAFLNLVWMTYPLMWLGAGMAASLLVITVVLFVKSIREDREYNAWRKGKR